MIREAFNTNWTVNGKPVTLPHDAQITEKRGPKVSDGGHGYFPGGIYTYEKTFFAPEEWAEKTILVEFEGVYRNAEIRLNGEKIFFHAYGYTGFYVELTGLTYGKDNTITVIADNSKLPNSRWYTGAGIYRPVWLHICEKDGLRPGSVKLSTVTYDPAVVRVQSPIPVQAQIDGIRGEGTDFELTIPEARLWSDEEPNLYDVQITAGTEELVIPFGIRKIEWSSQGLFINGKETLLRGACVHHDNGIVGAASFPESEERRVRILKENGFNAIRSSHNPASTAMVEACDRLGMYLMDETFDMWYNRKTANDYGLDWADHWQGDIAAMINRDFNHPSVILYSIGNEVGEPAEAKGLEAAKAQIDFCHALDSSRPVTCGVNLMILTRAAKGNAMYKDGELSAGGKQTEQKEESGKTKNASLIFNIMTSFIGSGMNKGANSKKADAIISPFLDLLDIAGYNYGSGRYPLEAKAHPDRVIFGSETFPQEIGKNWAMVKQFPYLVGDFMWTGWDYLGEAGIGAWSYTGGMPFNRPYPWILGGAGVIDILGNPDGSCKYAQTVFGQAEGPQIAVRPVNHPGVRPSRSAWRGTNAMLSWSWNGCDGNQAVVEVYAQADSVELKLNGKSLGRRKIKDSQAKFKIRYAPGTLTAIAYDAGGREIGQNQLASATGSFRLVAHPEKETVRPGEILYVPIAVEGENGVVESNADRTVTVCAEGGELLAFGSANPCTKEEYHTGTFTTYYGRALAIVRAGQEKVVLTVRDGETDTTVEIPVVQ